MTSRTTTSRVRFLPAIAAAVFLTGAVAGCADSSSSAGVASETSMVSDEVGLSMQMPWVRAQDALMTGMFGTLRNTTDADITLVKVEAITEGIGMLQLHEVAADGEGNMVMQQKQGGILIPANSEHELIPGGDHIMLMDLDAGIEVGEEIVLNLITDTGETLEVTATARAFTEAEEEYLQESMGGGMSGDADGGMHGDMSDSEDN